MIRPHPIAVEALVEKILALPREQQIGVALFVEWLHSLELTRRAKEAENPAASEGTEP